MATMAPVMLKKNVAPKSITCGSAKVRTINGSAGMGRIYLDRNSTMAVPLVRQQRARHLAAAYRAEPGTPIQFSNAGREEHRQLGVLRDESSEKLHAFTRI